jgi:hypothetical protein
VKGLQHLAVLEDGGRDDSGGAAAEAYGDRAFPMDDISITQIQGAIAADAKVKARGAKLGSKWDSIGPTTLNVDRLGTQAFTAPTQSSGRVTALVIDPKCKPQECTLYVGAAGGGVWRSKNALAPNPSRGRRRPRPDDRRRCALVARPRCGCNLEPPGDRRYRGRARRSEPHRDRHPRGRARPRLEQHQHRDSRGAVARNRYLGDA